MEKEIKKEYANEEMTIVWKPKICIHAAECVKALPNVYKPKDKPWIQIKNASTEELKNQIDKCPSGALSYYMNGQPELLDKNVATKVEVVPKGPLLVHGTLSVKNKDGQEALKSKSTAFCRCGASNNKPYCDGTHKQVGFED